MAKKYTKQGSTISVNRRTLVEKDTLDDIPVLQKRAAPRPISDYQIYLSGGYTLKEIGGH
jgi:hypothetical protein